MWRWGQGGGAGLGRGLARLCPAAVGLALGALGCAGGASPIVARVGATTITEAEVSHWARVIAATGNGFEGLGPAEPGGPRRRALTLLVDAAWLRREALARGVAPSNRAVVLALERRREVNGSEEFEQGLRASGQTIADVRLEIEAQLAALALRRSILSAVPALGDREIRAYYEAHRALFRTPEKRMVVLREGLRSPAAARALVRRIGTGAAFGRSAFHEVLQLHGGWVSGHDSERVIRAAFASPVGVASRPLPLRGHWTVFVVEKVVSARSEPLIRVRAQIVKRLTQKRRERALAAFRKAHGARWAALVEDASEAGS